MANLDYRRITRTFTVSATNLLDMMAATGRGAMYLKGDYMASEIEKGLSNHNVTVLNNVFSYPISSEIGNYYTSLLKLSFFRSNRKMIATMVDNAYDEFRRIWLAGSFVKALSINLTISYLEFYDKSTKEKIFTLPIAVKDNTYTFVSAEKKKLSV